MYARYLEKKMFWCVQVDLTYVMLEKVYHLNPQYRRIQKLFLARLAILSLISTTVTVPVKFSTDAMYRGSGHKTPRILYLSSERRVREVSGSNLDPETG